MCLGLQSCYDGVDADLGEGKTNHCSQQTRKPTIFEFHASSIL
jgi:hypothetical protein